MQEGVFDTSSDVNRVVTAIRLDIGTCEGIANLKAVFTLATEEGRLDSWTCQANRVVVLVGIQLNAGEPERVELETVGTRSTKKS